MAPKLARSYCATRPLCKISKCTREVVIDGNVQVIDGLRCGPTDIAATQIDDENDDDGDDDDY